MIYLTGQEAASIADILNDTRLSSIPYDGQITVQALCNLNNATNSMSITIQLPNGSVPVDTQRVSAGLGDDVLGGQLRADYLDQWSFPASQGGHFTIAFAETGACVLTWRVRLGP